MSQLFASGGLSIGPSASASVLPMNIQSWFPLELTGLISLLSKGTLKSLLQHHNAKASILQRSVFFFNSPTRTLYLLLEFSNSGYAVISTNIFFFKKEMIKMGWLFSVCHPRSILQLSLPCSGPWKLTSTLVSLPPAFCWVHTVGNKTVIRIWRRQSGWGISFCTPVSIPTLHPHCLVSTGELTTPFPWLWAISSHSGPWVPCHLSLESLTQP